MEAERGLKLRDILKPENVKADLKSDSIRGLLTEMVDMVVDEVPVKKDELVRILAEREEQSPTAMSGGVAVPHARIPELSKFVLAVGRSEKGVSFGAEDGPTRLFFLLAAPTDDTVTHLKILARIARIFRNKNPEADIKKDLLAAGSTAQIYERLMREDAGI